MCFKGENAKSDCKIISTMKPKGYLGTDAQDICVVLNSNQKENLTFKTFMLYLNSLMFSLTTFQPFHPMEKLTLKSNLFQKPPRYPKDLTEWLELNYES